VFPGLTECPRTALIHVCAPAKSAEQVSRVVNQRRHTSTEWRGAHGYWCDMQGWHRCLATAKPCWAAAKPCVGRLRRALRWDSSVCVCACVCATHTCPTYVRHAAHVLQPCVNATVPAARQVCHRQPVLAMGSDVGCVCICIRNSSEHSILYQNTAQIPG